MKYSTTIKDLEISGSIGLKKWVLFMYIITGKIDNEDIYTIFNLLTGISKTKAESLHKKTIELGLVENVGQS